MGSLCLGLGVSQAIRLAIMEGVGVLTAPLSWSMINVYVNSNNSLAETWLRPRTILIQIV